MLLLFPFTRLSDASQVYSFLPINATQLLYFTLTCPQMTNYLHYLVFPQINPNSQFYSALKNFVILLFSTYQLESFTFPWPAKYFCLKYWYISLPHVYRLYPLLCTLCVPYVYHMCTPCVPYFYHLRTHALRTACVPASYPVGRQPL